MLFINVCMKIISVSNKKQLKRFITFPEKLYKNEPNWVPPFHFDEINTLTKKNPAFDFCEAEYFLVIDNDDKILGRIAAIINHRANEQWNEKSARFGWIDFIENREVLKLLIDTVKNWAKARGMQQLKGPLGFSDMDKEGLLVDGFQYLSPMTCIYNFPYYGPMLEELGFTKDADWTQRILDVPKTPPERLRLVNVVEERYGLHLLQPKTKKDITARGRDMFHIINEAFAPLYEFTPLTEKQIDCYVKQYVPFVNKDFLSFILDNEGNTVGFALCIPFLSRAFQKAKGKLFPFGFLHLLHDLRHNDTLEALMIGVIPKYQRMGANILIYKYIYEGCVKNGIKKLLLNPQLEDNFKVQQLFGDLTVYHSMRRRSYILDLSL